MDKQVRILKREKGAGWLETIQDALRLVCQGYKGDVKITVEPHQETRRQAQNRLIWVINNQAKKHLEKHHGLVEDAEDLHEYFVGKILPKRVVNIMGEPEVKRTKTSKLNVASCAEYITKLVHYLEDNYNMKVVMPEDLRFAVFCEQVQEEQDKEGM